MRFISFSNSPGQLTITWTSFPEGEEADRILHLVSRLRISGALPLVLRMPLGG